MYRELYNRKPGEDDLSEKLNHEKGRDVEFYKRISLTNSDDNSKSRVVRIFISSTFKDFYWEREILVKTVFPRLRNWCEERNIFLLECDLRWGVPKEATGQEAILTCLEEIEKSREEMNGENFFLGLIGQRYGWSPKMEEVGNFIAERYSWINGASVTLMEIVFGALRTLSPNSLFMIREPDFISYLDNDSRKVYCDTEPDVAEKISTIQRALAKIFEEKQVQRYSCEFEGMMEDKFTGKTKAKIGGLDDFAESVYQFFESAIEKQLSSCGSDKSLRVSSDNDHHKILFTTLTRNAHCRSEFLTSLVSSILDNEFQSLSEEQGAMKEKGLASHENGRKIICLYGPAGIGKSTMMACLVRELLVRSNLNVFYHFCGASISSKTEEEIRSRIVDFLRMGEETTKTDLNELMTDVKSPTVIVIDALDEISQDGAKILSWLPFNTPKNVSIVISCLDKMGPVLDRIDERSVEKLEVKPLDNENCVQLVHSFFKDYGKKLDDKQIESLLNHKSSNNPLWLTLACEELRIHGDYSSLSLAISVLPDDIHDLNKLIMSRLINDDKTGLLHIFLQIMFISRVGVWETDIRRILATLTNCEHTEISNLVWNQIVRTLKPFVNRESNPLPVIKFRHRIMKEAVFEELFKASEEAEKLHSSLADFYRASGNSNYKGIELAYHLYGGHRWLDLISYLRSKESWQFIRRPFTRHQLMRSMRCMQMTQPNQKENLLKLCQFCKNSFGYLSSFSPNGNSCLFCGGPHFDFSEARLCSRHEMENVRFKENCIACKRPCAMGKFFSVKICMMCSNVKNRCAKLITEKDHLFQSAKNMAVKKDSITW